MYCALQKAKNQTDDLGRDALDINALNAFPPNFENDQKRVIDTNTASELIKIAEILAE